LKALLVNLLAALNFANVFQKIKKMFGKLKNVKNVKNVTKIKKNVKNVFFTSTRSSVGDRILGIARPGGITAHSLQPSQALSK